MNDPFSHTHYELRRQFFKMMGANFRIYGPDGQLALFAHQKAFKLKEDIGLFHDEGRSSLALQIQARQIMDFSAAYDVVDPLTGPVGVLRREGFKSLVRDSWQVCDATGSQIGEVVEDSQALALLRRLLTNWVPQNFDLMVGGQRAADLKQQFNPFLYNLRIDVTPGLVDTRLILASAVLLAAIEGRQE